jgi:hypothetical protein
VGVGGCEEPLLILILILIVWLDDADGGGATLGWDAFAFDG